MTKKIPEAIKIPIVNIHCADGSQLPITELPDEMLVAAYLKNSDYNDAYDFVRLLEYALIHVKDSKKRSGAVLRQCLVGGKCLCAVYPGCDEYPPKDAQFIGDIMDGGLYLV